MRQKWASGQPARVDDYLSAVSQPSSTLLLDLIYAEYALREEHGERPNPDEYVRRFPELRAEILRQLDVHHALSSDDGRFESDLKPSPQNDPPQPERIGKYRILSVLGSGGQATAYAAYHPELSLEVVLKVPRSRSLPSPAGADRLRAEGRVLARLDHPNLARVLDLDVHDGLPFLVLERVPGRTLAAAYGVSRPRPEVAADLVARVAAAVATAHRVGVTHCDIKPENIILTPDGCPKLIDFGLAAVTPVMGDTGSGAVCGTLGYMAPELARGDAAGRGDQSDVFALGGVLYFLLTGRQPYGSGDAVECLNRAARGEWDSAPLRDSSTPHRLIVVCRRAMAAEPSDRYPTAAALADELRAACRPGGRWRIIAAAILAIAIGVCLAGAVASSFGPSVGKPPPIPIPPPAVVPTTAPPPAVRVRVWTTDRYNDLAKSLPLAASAEIRVETYRTGGWHTGLVWISGSDEVRELGTAGPGDCLSIPAAVDRSLSLAGGGGTEAVLLCGRRSGPVAPGELSGAIGSTGGWAVLPANVWVRVGPDGVTAEAATRGPGLERYRPDLEGEVVRKLDAVRSKLRERFETVVGVAFAHP